MPSSLIEQILDPEQPPAVIAELSGNHNQNLDTAKSIIELAAKADADAVKLQTYTADSLTLPFDSPDFIVQGGLWDGRSLHELYSKASTPYDWHTPLKSYANALGLEIFSTPFDESAVTFLEESIAPTLYKVSSFEVTHIPLLQAVAATRKPVILSTGMATSDELDEAVETLRSGGCPTIVLLKCISSYPSEPRDFNLRSMLSLKERYRCEVGLSDHCLGSEVAIAATALGARVIEKHLTDDRSQGGIDAGFSLEPKEFKAMVASVHTAHAALGEPTIQASVQDESQKMFRRSIYIQRDIQAGEPLSSENLRIIRPSFGLEPKRWTEVLGKPASANLKAGSPLKEGDWNESHQSH